MSESSAPIKFVTEFGEKLSVWLLSPEFYLQAAAIAAAFISAFIIASFIKRNVKVFKEPPAADSKLKFVKNTINQSQVFLFPILNIVAMGLVIEFASFSEKAWLVRLSQGIALAILVSTIINKTISNQAVAQVFKVLLIPISLLYALGWLGSTSEYLNSISFKTGNIEISVADLVRVIIFGYFIVWIGKSLTKSVTTNVRQRQDIDLGTKEVVVKLFEVGMFVIVAILLLQVMGINITALAVFGGALAVGLGFGLQSIASNFISGMIILLDRSVVVGDYVELEDGQQGKIRAINMRSTTVETYDGKDVVVPNEKFITASFINWTHKNTKQRYDIKFSIAYSTDLHRLFEVLRDVVASHPQVISGPDVPKEEWPDAEIESFGDSGINILIEYWMEGIDDGRNRVGADLNLMIWDALKEHGFQMPFPQREVRILNQDEF